ncbi:MAG: hypothetical protein A2Y97_08480 [Nitrospirae bacterium RBG_13_39_12]|nr:MAG: hypothetical protein A2Y97_08480 [Nitrospirae bacterium RBG_13_39_12]
MNKRLFVYISTVITFFTFIFIQVSAGEVKDIFSKKNMAGKDICSAVKKTIKDGMNTREVVRTGIELGHSACLVVKCAIAGGGNLKEIITGAIEAGAPSNVVSRCSMDAGADPKAVSTIIVQAGLLGCYFEPEGLEPIEVELPGGDQGGGFISPYSF